MFYNDSDEVPEGPVVVRRPVYDAGMKLEAETGFERTSFRENSREKVHGCHGAGDAQGEVSDRDRDRGISADVH
jgi:hypothetical protein